ncbi:MAG: acetate kinase [Clostridia bacterium]|nr:acetate kinase [Clostridia bacterium]
MKILIINAGSSSLKYQLIDMDNESVIAKGLVERIGTVDPTTDLTYTWCDKKIKEKHLKKAKNHAEAMSVVLDVLVGKDRQDAEYDLKEGEPHLVNTGVISDLSEIGAVGHRVLHGGEKFTASCLIDDTVIAAIEENIPLGPLHNPANLMGIRACQEVLPNVPQVAVFDTAFHQTMPPKAFRYAIPNEYYTDLHIRKYGFHGTSHRYISARAIELLKLPANSRVIICHLGNGSSLSACVDGKCVDTSMGITPLDGLVMGTRCGTLDPAVVEFIANRKNMTPTEVLTMMNKKSGLLGLAGDSDMRNVTARYDAGEPEAKLAIEMWAYVLKKYIGSYAAAMGGVDAVIFTAGIGENHVRAREWAVEGLEFMGIKVDHERNVNARGEAKISPDDSKVQVWVIPTNEELAIARDTLDLATTGKVR